MSHLPTLITDLALILASAGLMTLIFKRLKQPSVLGYIVAGILAGPHITLTPTVIDSGNIQTWADIGVIFLLFALGVPTTWASAELTSLAIRMNWPLLNTVTCG
jgi:CPA2 family monovalent cation:H+ antiporter-2